MARGPVVKPLARVRDTVLAVRQALAGQGDYVGTTLTMSRFRSATAPAAVRCRYSSAPSGHGCWRWRVRSGDGVCLNLMPPRVVIRQLAEVRRGAGAAGRELPADFGVMARLQTVVTDEPGRCQRDAAKSVHRAVPRPARLQPVPGLDGI